MTDIHEGSEPPAISFQKLSLQFHPPGPNPGLDVFSASKYLRPALSIPGGNNNAPTKYLHPSVNIYPPPPITKYSARGVNSLAGGGVGSVYCM